jgi:hypothetical protein
MSKNTKYISHFLLCQKRNAYRLQFGFKTEREETSSEILNIDNE